MIDINTVLFNLHIYRQYNESFVVFNGLPHVETSTRKVYKLVTYLREKEDVYHYLL